MVLEMRASLLVLLCATGSISGLAAQERRPRDASGAGSLVPVVAEVMGNNLVLFAYHRYFRDGWNYGIGFESWARNFREGPYWDGNPFEVNQFSHPYHGGLYFNSARSHGYSYWGAMPFTFLGAFIWEFFMETTRPSANDLVNTTVGGLAVGEATYRLSSYMLQNGGRNPSPLNTITAILFNPVNGLHGLLSSVPHPIRADPTPTNLQGILSFGYQQTTGVADRTGPSAHPALKFVSRYGDPFAGDYDKPFDTFELIGQLRFGYRQPLGRFHIQGMLIGTALGPKEDASHIVGAFQHLDFVDDEALQFGGQSFSAGVLSRFRIAQELELRTAFHLSGLLLGAISSEHAGYVEQGRSRTYDYGPGLGLRLNLTARHASDASLALMYTGSWVHSVDGADAEHLAHLLDAELRMPLLHSFGLALEYQLLARNSFFKEFTNVHRLVRQFQIYVSARMH